MSSQGPNSLVPPLQRALPANFPACPPIDLPNLHTLLNYAKKYDFGLQ